MEWSFLSEDITQQRIAEAKINHLARLLDALTGLPNRATLRDRMEPVVRTNGGPTICAPFISSISTRFKQVNDTLGHTRGDVLCEAVGFGGFPRGGIGTLTSLHVLEVTSL